MKNEPKGHFRVPVNRQGDTPPADRHSFQTQVARAGALGLLFISLCGAAAAQGVVAEHLKAGTMRGIF